MIRVTAVQPESIAEELGLAEGTELLAVNGRELEDFLDWEFLTAEEEFLLHVRQPDGEEIEFEIERPLGEPLGVSLEPARIRRCANRCDFCFVDGLPDGLRDVLYIRDDDYRLSFRYGNFATLTNLKPKDIERIIEYRLSPLYVSVHATDPMVRRYLLRNPTAPEILPQLRHFADHGIEFHTQVVMSPGVNDGAVLEQTLARALRVRAGHPAAARWCRSGSPSSASITSCASRPPRSAGRRSAWSRPGPRSRGGSAASTGRSAPTSCTSGPASSCRRPRSTTASTRSRTASAACAGCSARSRPARTSSQGWAGRRIGVVTGTAMGQLMPMVLEPLARATGATFELIPVVNTLFGASVTTAGLLPGTAIQQALAGRRDLDLALLPGEAHQRRRTLHGQHEPRPARRPRVPMELRLSKDFIDALHVPAAA